MTGIRQVRKIWTRWVSVTKRGKFWKKECRPVVRSILLHRDDACRCNGLHLGWMPNTNMPFFFIPKSPFYQNFKSLEYINYPNTRIKKHFNQIIPNFVSKYEFMARKNFNFSHVFLYQPNHILMESIQTACCISIGDVREVAMLWSSNTLTKLVKLSKITTQNFSDYII